VNNHYHLLAETRQGNLVAEKGSNQNGA